MGIAQDVADRIREARKAAGLSRAELATATGATHRTITSWEQGQRSPSIEGLSTIAQALSVPAGSLLGDTEPPVDEAISRLARVEGVHAVLLSLARFVSDSS